MICPLCHSSHHKLFHQEQIRHYLRCNQCQLVYLHDSFRLNQDREKEEYDLHQNSPDDLNYRMFLSRLFNPLLPLLNKGDKGLDFGCGNGPTLSKMFEEQGYEMSLYDEFYCKDRSVFDDQFDFIVSSEVFEHLFGPKQVLEKLLSILKNAGTLGVMTKLVRDQESFSTWHYINDPTHVCFFSIETFDWIALKYHLTVKYYGTDIILLTRN